MKTSETVENVMIALSKFQSIVQPPKKNGFNPHFKNKYPTLQDVLDVVQPAIKETGLSYLNFPEYSEDGKQFGYRIRIYYKSEFVEFPPIFGPVNSNNWHQVGSSNTYALRYALSSAFGLAGEVDDDGNAASEPTNTKPKQSKQQHEKPAPQKQKQAVTNQHESSQAKKSDPMTKFFTLAGKFSLNNDQQRLLIYGFVNRQFKSRKEITNEEWDKINKWLGANSTTAEKVEAAIKKAEARFDQEVKEMDQQLNQDSGKKVVTMNDFKESVNQANRLLHGEQLEDWTEQEEEENLAWLEGESKKNAGA